MGCGKPGGAIRALPATEKSAPELTSLGVWLVRQLVRREARLALALSDRGAWARQQQCRARCCWPTASLDGLTAVAYTCSPSFISGWIGIFSKKNENKIGSCIKINHVFDRPGCPSTLRCLLALFHVDWPVNSAACKPSSALRWISTLNFVWGGLQAACSIVAAAYQKPSAGKLSRPLPNLLACSAGRVV